MKFECARYGSGSEKIKAEFSGLVQIIDAESNKTTCRFRLVLEPTF